MGLGEARISAEAQAVDELVSLCARLPLALCNTVGRAAAHPDLPLAGLAASMREEQGRLDTLETGEKVTSARMVFSWSHAKLSDRAELVFRLMAVHPGPDVTVPSAASLTGLTRRDAYLSLAELSDGYLVTEHMPGRYTCHELLRAYAGELARARDTDDERRAALRRVLDHYLHSADAAARYLLPDRTPRTLRRPLPGVVPEGFRSPAEAEEWVRSERPVLLAAIGQAADEELSPHAWELPWIAGPFLRGAVSWQATAEALERVLVTTRRLDEVTGQAMAHGHLGWLRLRLGAYASAYEHLDAALPLARKLKDRRLVALMHLLRARVFRSQLLIIEALREAEQSLRLYRAVGDRFGEFRALTEVSWQLSLLGDRRGAEVFRSQAREMRRSLAAVSAM
jgi:tetratricopeptide (TPR) repeat protein